MQVGYTALQTMATSGTVCRQGLGFIPARLFRMVLVGRDVILKTLQGALNPPGRSATEQDTELGTL